MFGDKSGEPVIERQIKSEDKMVRFLDFVQAMAVRAVRIERKIPLSKIRQAIRIAEDKYGVSQPFARRHKTFLVGDEIIIKLNEDEYVQVSGKHARNRVITEVVELYMIDLGFSREGLANCYTPERQGNYVVSLNPEMRFGEPLLPSCGYSARALWDAYKVEGGIERAAKAYGVKTQEVELACRYYDKLLDLAV